MKRVRPHMFRDTIAVGMLLADVPIEQVSMNLGHKSVKTSEELFALGSRSARAPKLIAAYR